MFELALFCFHFAGGAARSFDGLKAAAPPWLKVTPLDLPGHGVRRGEPVLTGWPAIVEDASRQVRDRLGAERSPYALLGHSMGALVATEVAHVMAGIGHLPVWLGIAAAERSAARQDEPDWLTCPDARVMERLRELQGTPPDLLESQSLMQIVLPIMRADLALCKAYAPPPRPKLPCALLALGGMRDDITEQQLQEWREETRVAFDVRMLAGDHFFLTQAPQDVAAIIGEAVAQAAMGSR